ncbi:MAG: diguanylate cyclase [Chloroflexi bacterium]|nr:diguanylate cyclase [Chloroflexota bacterium]
MSSGPSLGGSGSGLTGSAWDPADSTPSLTGLRPARLRRFLLNAEPAVSRPGPEHGSEADGRFDTVLRIAARLASSHDRDELFTMLVDETLGVLGVDHVTLRMIHDERLVMTAWAGLDEAAVRLLPVWTADQGWLDDVVRTSRVAAWPGGLADRRQGLRPRASGRDAARRDGSGRDVSGDASGRHASGRDTSGRDTSAELLAPLLHGGRLIGVLSAVSREPRAWTNGDGAFLNTAAAHAAIALANAELFEQTEARAAQVAVLQAASNRLNRVSTVEGVGRTIVEETRRIIEYHNARVYLIEGPDDVVPIAFEGRVGAYDLVDLDLLRCKVGEGFTGWVAANGQPLLVNDANADPRGQTIPGTDEIDESMLIVPMCYDGITVGVITLSKLGCDGFDANDLRLLTILADQAATAVESARRLTRSQNLAGELRRLLEMSGELSESLDPRQVADLMGRYLARAMNVDQCVISYWDRPSGRLESLGAFPPALFEDATPYFDVSNYPETLCVLERQTLAIVDAEDPAADPAEVSLLRQHGNRMLAMLPLVAKGQSIGLVELFAKGGVQWTPDRLELARTMANEAAMALENARLYEDARKLADRDPLTGFYNHRFLHERLGEEVVRAQRARQPVSVLMVDLDDFKLVNDTFGHLFGDRVLTWTAERIRSALRASDVATRYGGDEFALILPETDAADAQAAANRILEAFRTSAFAREGRRSVPVALSIGTATFPADGRSATDLIAAADAALYRVKRSGGHDASSASSPSNPSGPPGAASPSSEVSAVGAALASDEAA